jgi:hypothetical protein
MKQLKKNFLKNDIMYVILNRSRNYYLAELRSLETDCIHAYECGRLLIRPERTIKGKHIDSNESIISNEQFGKHPADIVMPPKKKDYCFEHYLKYAEKDLNLNLNNQYLITE